MQVLWSLKSSDVACNPSNIPSNLTLALGLTGMSVLPLVTFKSKLNRVFLKMEQDFISGFMKHPLNLNLNHHPILCKK